MPVRMTGMISGMDTESLIKSMVDAQKLKNKRTTDKSVLLEWKQEKWKELNTKLYKLYQEDLSKLRLQGNFGTRKVTTSDDKLVEVKADNNTSTGTNTIEVNGLASTQSVTSVQLELKNDAGIKVSVNSSTKLKDLILDDGLNMPTDKDAVINIGYKGKETALIITDNTTLGDLVSALKRAGLNASFDSNQQRLFISAKNSGSEEKFTVTTAEISKDANTSLTNIVDLLSSSSLGGGSKEAIVTTLDSIREQVKSFPDKNVLSSLYESIKNGTAVVGNTDAEKSVINSLITLKNNLISSIEAKTRQEATGIIKNNIKTDLLAKNGGDIDATIRSNLTETVTKELEKSEGWSDKSEAEQEQEILAEVEKKFSVLTTDDKSNYINNLVNKEFTSTEPSTIDGVSKAKFYSDQVETEYNKEINSRKASALTDMGGYITSYATAVNTDSTSSKSLLTAFGLNEIATDVNGNITTSGDGKNTMKVVGAQNAIFVFNGVEYESNSNVLNVNGYSITAKGTTNGQAITLNTISNTQENYDMVKKFVTNYNAILKEMNELYYAASSKGYAPLSDDEKESMSDKQIEKWEDKIKGSILRRDDSLGGLLSSMNSAIMSTIDVDGKKYSLSSFGIGTSSDYTEKGLLHIDGDADDALVSNLTNKLMKALEEEPEVVSKVISGVAKNLYDNMSDKMKAIPNVRSAFTFYNDKSMATQQTEYQKRIKILENKLVEIENKYYKQFAAMESALSKLQSQTNALAGMLGTSSN